jgi:L-ascorbate metabolism protein UlaG (beta-lactamase superfamily)
MFRPTEPAPVAAPLPFARDDARLAALWVGHSTVLLQLDDAVVATDPVVTRTVGTLAKRLVAPGLSAEHWPHVDLVAISHVHFDHLSLGSLAALEPKIGYAILPTGGLSYLPDFAFDAAEVTPWTSVVVRGVRATAVPARHGAGRWWIDASWSTAVGGWVFESNGLSVYFAGDTGFDAALFESIRARWPRMDLALLPIAPVEPHDEVGAWHMDPAEAVRAFRLLGAEVMLPIHYDTFLNSLDDPGDALRALDAAVKDQAVDATRVRPLRIGERAVVVPSPIGASEAGP